MQSTEFSRKESRLACLLAFAALLTFTSCGNGQATVHACAPKSGSDVGQLLSSPREDVGKLVTLLNVPVHKVGKEHTFWIGAEPCQVLVVSDEEAVTGRSARTHPPLAPGSVVTINGVLVKPPAKRDAARKWGLTGEEVQQLQTDGVYLAADQVKVQ